MEDTFLKIVAALRGTVGFIQLADAPEGQTDWELPFTDFQPGPSFMAVEREAHILTVALPIGTASAL